MKIYTPLLAVIPFILSSCGQVGPLYLPGGQDDHMRNGVELDPTLLENQKQNNPEDIADDISSGAQKKQYYSNKIQNSYQNARLSNDGSDTSPSSNTSSSNSGSGSNNTNTGTSSSSAGPNNNMNTNNSTNNTSTQSTSSNGSTSSSSSNNQNNNSNSSTSTSLAGTNVNSGTNTSNGSNSTSNTANNNQSKSYTSTVDDNPTTPARDVNTPSSQSVDIGDNFAYNSNIMDSSQAGGTPI